MKKKPTILSWKFAFIGLKMDLLAPNDVIDLLSNSLLDSLTNDDIGDLYSNIDSKIGMMNILQKFIGNDINFDAEIKRWQVFLLKSIESKQENIQEKLKQIANLWAFFDYPEDWEKFIYYIPNANYTTEEQIYATFQRYISS